MDGLLTRPYQPGDAEAIVQLAREAAGHAGGHFGKSAADLAAYLAGHLANPETDSRLVVTADGDLAAMGFVGTPPPGGSHVDLLGGVHPAWRGRGIGRELLAWQLARAGELHRAVAPNREWEAELSINTGDQPAVRLFERFGLAPVRYWFDMVAPTGPVDAAVPAELRVEPYDARYDRDLHAVHVGVFAEHWGYQPRPFDLWAPMTIRSASFRPDLSVLAFDGDEIVGYVLAYTENDPDRIYIGQVGVVQRWRRRGVAGGLLARALATAGKAGFGRAGLVVDAASPVGAVGVYERVGFTVESRTVTYRTKL
ncbi:MAG TPA: GNAT family N-acetyltransferase [Natronosporangium sp.]